MTSILTNVSAFSALQTLRSLSSNLDDTQRMVSSGRRIEVAADNAAYWSISTTMRSDRMAVSAVSDALGLGAAKVDVAYAGMQSVIDILAKFKAKVVAAKEAGVDKAKIQTELEQLKEQVVGIANAASFNGQNWLNTDIAELDEGAKASVVSSFLRNQNGTVAVKTTEVALKDMSLFNKTGGGLLQSASISKKITTPGGQVSDVGGILTGATSPLPHYGHSWFMFAGSRSLGASDQISFTVTVDANGSQSAGSSYNVTIDQATVNSALGRSDGAISSASDMVAVLQAALTAAGAPADSSRDYHYWTAPPTGTLVDIYSKETLAPGMGSSIVISGVTSTLSGNYSFGLAQTSSHNNIVPSAFLNFTAGFQLTATSSFSFDVDFPNLGTSQSYSVTKADVDAVLGTSDGIISNAGQLAQVLNATVSDMTFSASQANMIIATPASTGPHVGRQAIFSLSNASATDVLTVETTLTSVTVTGSDFLSIDVTSGTDIDDLVSSVEVMAESVISGAAILGALSTRIDMQAEFASRMTGNIDKGIGRLVDADMNEASTRLKAIQTQEQLAIQSLSIANQNADNVVQLFR